MPSHTPVPCLCRPSPTPVHPVCIQLYTKDGLTHPEYSALSSKHFLKAPSEALCLWGTLQTQTLTASARHHLWPSRCKQQWETTARYGQSGQGGLDSAHKCRENRLGAQHASRATHGTGSASLKVIRVFGLVTRFNPFNSQRRNISRTSCKCVDPVSFAKGRACLQSPGVMENHSSL